MNARIATFALSLTLALVVVVTVGQSFATSVGDFLDRAPVGTEQSITR